jgi:hypothetical protein
MRDRTEAPPASASSPASTAPEKLPPLPLAAAGLTALDGLVTLASLVLFAWDSNAATPIIQLAAPFLVVAGVAAVIVGGIIQVKNKRSGFTMEGAKWAAPAIIAGLALMAAAVFLPLVYALSMLVDESG